MLSMLDQARMRNRPTPLRPRRNLRCLCSTALLVLATLIACLLYTHRGEPRRVPQLLRDTSAGSEQVAAATQEPEVAEAEKTRWQKHRTKRPPTARSVEATEAAFDAFVKLVANALDARLLPVPILEYIFSRDSPIHPRCDGEWMEFGAGEGRTIGIAADWRRLNCIEEVGELAPIYAFDTFTGQPEEWVIADGFTLGPGFFALPAIPTFPNNVKVVQGVFAETLPWLLATGLAQESGKNASEAQISYLHIDSGTYRSTRDVLTHLSPLIKPGAVLVFDELVNYQYYRKHEIRAFWEWMVASGSRVKAIGLCGPMPRVSYGVELLPGPGFEVPATMQSAGFLVLPPDVDGPIVQM
ncbi:hypothetical protein WJX72_009345 [[Myrmecia] bisecta]|uniref:Methyltransferase n=1 Tax=[Myrmecia] bisecta TaxID=41462 RepID=A0AAW1PD06_9CHLO